MEASDRTEIWLAASEKQKELLQVGPGIPMTG
jgi:hypothetical protein